MSALLACLGASPARAWPGAHTTLTCTDCHAAEPDPAGDTAETVTFVAGDLTETCLLCHGQMRGTGASGSFGLMASLSATTVVRHLSSGVVPQAMYEHYRQWIQANAQAYSPPLDETALRMRLLPSGLYRFDCSTCHPGIGGGGYPRILMTNAELCVACHGGEGNTDDWPTPSIFSHSPRLLYNPAHLGVRDASGAELPAPSDPAYDGTPPAAGATVSGSVSLPVAFFWSFHTSVQENLNYRVAITGTAAATYEEPVETSRPMTWYTGIDGVARWPAERQMHRWDATGLPGGTYAVGLVPYDPINGTSGLPVAIEGLRVGRNPVLYIPGTMATKLYDGNELVWATIWDFLSDIGDDFLDPLELSKDSNGAPIEDSIGPSPDEAGTSGEITDWLSHLMMPREYLIVGARFQARLYDTLKEAGYTPHQGGEMNRFTFFPYDWRWGPDDGPDGGPDVQAELANRIAALLAANPNTTKVDVVAHSLGGLVLRKFLADATNRGKIGKAIFIGTPHLGAVKTFRVLQFGQGEFGFVFSLFTNENEAMKISQNWPVLYDLAPSQAFHAQAGYPEIFEETDVDLDSDGQLTAWDWGKVQGYLDGGRYYRSWYTQPAAEEENRHNGWLAAQAASLHGSMDTDTGWLQNADEVYLVVGQQEFTTGTLRLRWWDREDAIWPDAWQLYARGVSGDGTVPTRSADLQHLGGVSNLRRFYARGVGHNDLLDDPEMANLLAWILKGELAQHTLPEKIRETAFPDTLSVWEIIFGSPVDVHVFDAEGRHTGPVDRQRIQEEIPRVRYQRHRAPDGYETVIHLPLEGRYELVIASQGTGTFRMTARVIQESAVTKTAIYDRVPLIPRDPG